MIVSKLAVVICVLLVQFAASSYQSLLDQKKRDTAKRSANFDILDFKAYILKPINIDYKSIYPDRDAEEGPIAQALIRSNHDLPIAAALQQRPTPQPLRLGFQYFTDYFRNSAFNPEPQSAYLKSQINRPQFQSNKPRFEFLKQEAPTVFKETPKDQPTVSPLPVVVARPPQIKRDSSKDEDAVPEVNKKKILVDHVFYYPEEVKKFKEEDEEKSSHEESPKKFHIVVPDREFTKTPTQTPIPPPHPPKKFYNNHNQKRKIDRDASREQPTNTRRKDPIFDNVQNKTTLKITYDRVDEPYYKPYKPEKADKELLEPSQSRDNVVLESPPAETSTVQSKPEEQYFQDSFMSIKHPHVYEFGHIFDKLHSGWEERFERMNLKDQRFQGRVKWGTSDGGFGEHVWDLNHH